MMQVMVTHNMYMWSSQAYVQLNGVQYRALWNLNKVCTVYSGFYLNTRWGCKIALNLMISAYCIKDSCKHLSYI